MQVILLFLVLATAAWAGSIPDQNCAGPIGALRVLNCYEVREPDNAFSPVVPTVFRRGLAPTDFEILSARGQPWECQCAAHGVGSAILWHGSPRDTLCFNADRTGVMAGSVVTRRTGMTYGTKGFDAEGQFELRCR